MELTKAIETRRSIRKYKQQKVDRTILEEMIQAATLAPSWKNSQVSRYYVCESEEMCNKARNCLAEFNQTNCIDAPVLIVATIVKNRSGFNRDGSTTTELANEWGFFDNGMQCMNLMLKGCELGVDTLVMGIRDADALRNALSIPETELIGAVIAVGYRDIDPEMPKRKAVNEIAKFL